MKIILSIMESDYDLLERVLSCGRPAIIVNIPEELFKISFQIGVFPERVFNLALADKRLDCAIFGFSVAADDKKRLWKLSEIKELLPADCELISL